MEIKQYQIILVNLDSTIGREINKTRPCIVVSPDEMNQNLGTVIIAPMTTSTRKYPTRLPVFINNEEGLICLDQIRAVDKSRILKILGLLNKVEILNLKNLIKETLVD